MANREFNALDILLQMEADLLRSAGGVLRSVQFQPAADMYETEEALVIKLEMAGIRPDKLTITLSEDDRMLTIAGERVETQGERHERLRCHHLEIFYGTFERELRLPANIRFDREAVSATYRDGFLLINLPKRPEVLRGTRIVIVTEE